MIWLGTPEPQAGGDVRGMVGKIILDVRLEGE